MSRKRKSSGVLCKGQDCDRFAVARGMCQKHWQRWYLTTPKGQEYVGRADVKRRNLENSRRTEAKAARRSYKLEKRYGLTPEQVAAMYAEQKGCCKICEIGVENPLTDRAVVGRSRSRTVAHVDHCHATGRVRGLLCASCNKGLGAFKDDPELFHAAAKYLSAGRSTGGAPVPVGGFLAGMES